MASAYGIWSKASSKSGLTSSVIAEAPVGVAKTVISDYSLTFGEPFPSRTINAMATMIKTKKTTIVEIPTLKKIFSRLVSFLYEG